MRFALGPTEGGCGVGAAPDVDWANAAEPPRRCIPGRPVEEGRFVVKLPWLLLLGMASVEACAAAVLSSGTPMRRPCARCVARIVQFRAMPLVGRGVVGLLLRVVLGDGPEGAAGSFSLRAGQPPPPGDTGRGFLAAPAIGGGPLPMATSA